MRAKAQNRGTGGGGFQRYGSTKHSVCVEPEAINHSSLRPHPKKKMEHYIKFYFLPQFYLMLIYLIIHLLLRKNRIYKIE